LIIGTNWFQGASHTTVAKDNLIRGYQTRERLADILTVFLDRGVDAILWVPTPELDLAVRDAEQRAGKLNRRNPDDPLQVTRSEYTLLGTS
jgi:hypothetical protein